MRIKACVCGNSKVETWSTGPGTAIMCSSCYRSVVAENRERAVKLWNEMIEHEKKRMTDH